MFKYNATELFILGTIQDDLTSFQKTLPLQISTALNIASEICLILFDFRIKKKIKVKLSPSHGLTS